MISETSSRNAARIAREIRRALKDGASAEHAAGVQWFFKEEVRSHGWYAADLRRLAARLRREIVAEGGLELLLDVADQLFAGDYLEERGAAIAVLQKDVAKFGDAEFRRFETWLARILSWADHDGLACFLIGPMIPAKPARVARVFRWAKSRDRWHRRAAAVSLIPGARLHMFFAEIQQLTELLLDDTDDMVQKGLGWLLRETAKADPEKTVPFLMTIRARAPRLVLRTACETLPPETRGKVLARTASARM